MASGKKVQNKNLLTDRLLRLSRSVWLLPVIGAVMLLLLTSLKINGSSIGDFYHEFYSGTKDPSLIAGAPRSIRSDEWEFETLMAAAQSKADFPRVNPNIGDGQNMEVVVDAPYKSWTAILKPHNWAFLILPFDYAFAFKWWLMAYLLIIGCYFLVLKLLPGKRLLSSFVAVGFFLSPFIQWWYRPITLGSIFFSFFIILAFLQLWKARDRLRQAIWIGLTGYLLACFAALLYPPFQIPCALVTVGFLVGFALEKGYLKNWKVFRPIAIKTALAIVIFSSLFLGFVAFNFEAIDAVRNTVYPGERVVASGGFDVQHFFSSFLSVIIQIPTRARNYIANPSEASNFILLAPFLTIPAIHMLIRKRNSKEAFDWPLAIISGLFILILIRLFLPGSSIIFKPFLFESIPHVRLFIGLGLINLLQFVLIMRHIKNRNIEYPTWLVGGYALVVFLFNLIIGFWNRSEFPNFINNPALITLLAAVPAIVIWLLGKRRFTPAAGLLLLFCLISAGAVNPVYRGTGPLINSELTKQISVIGANDDRKWIVADILTFENLPAVAGEAGLTGIYVYPQKELWQKTVETKDAEFVYNRFAHTLAEFTTGPTYLNLKQPDLFEIVTSPCSEFLKNQNVGYILSEKNYGEQYGCLKLEKAIAYPHKTFYIFSLPR